MRDYPAHAPLASAERPNEKTRNARASARPLDGRSCRKSGDAKGLPLAARERSGHTGGGGGDGAKWSGPAGIRPIGYVTDVGLSWKTGRCADQNIIDLD